MNRSMTPQQPLVAVALCFIIGVYIGWSLALGWGAVTIIALGVAALYYIFRRGWLLSVLLIAVGMLSVELERGDIELIEGVESEYSLLITSHNRLMVKQQLSNEGEWQGVEREIYYRADSTVMLGIGDEILASGRIRELGRSGFIYLSEGSILSIDAAGERSIPIRINEWVAGRIGELGLTAKSKALVEAMFIGQREGMSAEMQGSYRESGAAHLLAVSGLHIAIIFFIFNMLLSPLKVVPYGNIARNLLMIVVIWGYAAVVGMSVSVERAAIMFTLLQLSEALQRGYSSLNSVALAAIIITALNPSIIYDVGFQLSISALLSILLWALPAIGVVKRWIAGIRYVPILGFAIEYLLSALIIGVACSVATMPIVASTFGYFSPLGMLLNPIVVTTAYLLLLLASLWTLFGIGLAAPIFGYVIELIASTQNSIVELFGGSIRLDMDGYELLLIYLIYALLTLLARGGVRTRGGAIPAAARAGQFP